MEKTIERVKRVISYSELKALRVLADEIGENASAQLNIKTFSDKVGVARSVATSALRLLEVVGIVETRHMGMKGTYIKIIDRQALQEIIKE